VYTPELVHTGKPEQEPVEVTLDATELFDELVAAEVAALEVVLPSQTPRPFHALVQAQPVPGA
jgi:hypothetical protein